MKAIKTTIATLIMCMFVFGLFACASSVTITVHSLNDCIEDFIITTHSGADLSKWAEGDPNAVIPDGYIFDSYYEDPKMQFPYEVKDAPKKNKDIYINYKKTEVKITVKPISEQEPFIDGFVIVGTPGDDLTRFSAGNPDATINGKWKFVGYFYDEALTQRYYMTTIPDYDIELFVYYNISTQYSINFDTRDGNSILPYFAYQEDEIELPRPSKNGFVFAGWYKDASYTEKVSDPFVMPSQNIVLYAKWNRDEDYIKISYWLGSKLIHEEYSERGNKVKPFVEVDSNIVIDGWYTEQNIGKAGKEYDFDETPSGDLTLYANAYTKGLSIEDGCVLGCLDNKVSEIILPAIYDNKTVDEIADYAFQGCGFSEIILSETIKKIGKGAFYGCANLTAIYMNNGLSEIGDEAFANCSDLRSISIPDTIKTVDDFADIFYGCIELLNIGFSGDGGNTFYSSVNGDIYDRQGKTFIFAAPGKTKLEVADGTERILANSVICPFLTSLIIPDSVYEIANGAISGNCTYLKELTLPAVANNQTTENEKSFVLANLFSRPTQASDAEYIDYRDVPDSLKTVTLISISETTALEYSFNGCAHIENIYLPEGLTRIGAKAFCDCSSLKSIVIPDTVISIAGGVDAAFSNVESLQYYSAPFIGGSAYADNFLAYVFGAENYDSQYLNENGEKMFVPPSLKKVEISGGSRRYNNYMENIGEGALYHCAYIEKIILPSQITQIGFEAFRRCIRLKNIVHTDKKGVESCVFERVNTLEAGRKGSDFLYSAAFAECYSLEGLELPALKGEIPSLAFVGMGRYSDKFDYFAVGKAVTGLGERAFYLCSSLKTIEIEMIDSKLVSIGNNCFSGCSELENIAIPATVKELPQVLFENCDKLQSIEMPLIGNVYFDVDGERRNVFHLGSLFGASDKEETVKISSSGIVKSIVPNSLISVRFSTVLGDPYLYYSFYECKTIEEIEIPGGITEIGVGTFYHCDSLRNFVLPASVIKIEPVAFAYNYKLTSIGCYAETYNDKMFSIVGGVLFDSQKNRLISFPAGKKSTEYIVPPTVKELCEYSFSGAASLVTLNISKAVERIANNAFAGCDSLSYFTVSENSEIYKYDCNALMSKDGEVLYRYLGGAEYTIPDNVTYIADYAFYEHSGIRKLVVGSGVVSIGNYAFASSSLSEVDFSESKNLTKIGDYAFADTTINVGKNLDLSATAVQSVGKYTFANKSVNGKYYPSFAKLLLPDTLLTIGSFAFCGCVDVKELDIPSSVIEIDELAFLGADGLKTINIGTRYNKSALEKLGRSAFYSCSAEVMMYVNRVPSVIVSDWDKYGYLTTAPFGLGSKINVPGALLERFKTNPGWSPIKSKIFAMMGGISVI